MLNINTQDHEKKNCMLNGGKNPPRYEKNSHTGSIHEVRHIGINLLAILDIH